MGSRKSSRYVGLQRFVVAIAMACASAACGAGDPEDGAYLDHDEPSDLDPVEDGKADGIAAQFDRNRVVSDEFFNNTAAVDAAAVQRFLEATPYGGRRSFLADERVGGRLVSEVLVEISSEYQLNPIMLLSRIQVEQGLIGKSSRPSSQRVDYALGCGCPDGRNCNPTFRGLDKQLTCAADTLRTHYDRSEAGSGIWNAGATKRSLDPISVTPANHATASLYAYTPWVLVGSGGNWLVWNVTKRYVNALVDSGDLGESSNEFVGTACDVRDDAACDFESSGEPGFCVALPSDDDDADANAGYCSLGCEGLCPDRGGVKTFCVELTAGEGHCVPRADADDGCEDYEGTIEMEVERFVGDSNSSATMRTVCLPREAEADTDDEPNGDTQNDGFCEERCDSAEPINNGDDVCFCQADCSSFGDCCPGYEAACMPE